MPVKIDLKQNISFPTFDELPVKSIFSFFGCIEQYYKLSEEKYLDLTSESHDIYYLINPKDFVICYDCLAFDKTKNPDLVRLSILREGNMFICPMPSTIQNVIRESIYIFIGYDHQCKTYKAYDIWFQGVIGFEADVLVYPFELKKIELDNTNLE